MQDLVIKDNRSIFCDLNMGVRSNGISEENGEGICAGQLNARKAGLWHFFPAEREKDVKERYQRDFFFARRTDQRG